MAGIRFIDTNPAIDQFNAQVQRGDAERRAEEQDFMRRFQLEQQMGADKARRAGAEAYFASPQTVAAPVMPATATPSAGPSIAGYTAQPQEPDFEQVSPAPISTSPAPSAAQPAINSGHAQPMAARGAQTGRSGQDDRFARMAGAMAKTPGTGADLLRMVTADTTNRRLASTEERKTTLEGLKIFREAANHGDLATMRVANQKYTLGIPEDAMRNRQIAVALATGTSLAKTLDDERALAFGMGFTEALSTGATELEAMTAGNRAAAKVQVTPKEGTPHYYTAGDNTVQAVGRDRIARPVQGPKARPPQPPFALTQGGADTREQALANMAFDNAVKAAGRQWAYMEEPEQNALYQRELARLRGRSPAAATPAPAPPGAAPSKIMEFDAQGNQIR